MTGSSWTDHTCITKSTSFVLYLMCLKHRFQVTAWKMAVTLSLSLSQTVVRFQDVNSNRREFQNEHWALSPESVPSLCCGAPTQLAQGLGPVCPLLATVGICLNAMALLSDLWALPPHQMDDKSDWAFKASFALTQTHFPAVSFQPESQREPLALPLTH